MTHFPSTTDQKVCTSTNFLNLILHLHLDFKTRLLPEVRRKPALGCRRKTEGENHSTTRRAEVNSTATKVWIDSRVKTIGIVTSLTTFNDLDMPEMQTGRKDRSLKQHDVMLVLMFAFARVSILALKYRGWLGRLS